MTPALAERLAAVGLFDADWYRRTYADVAENGLSPWAHFLAHGWAEGRAPGPRFAPADYLAAHPDVAAAGVDALSHYLENGRREGRALAREPAWPEAPLPADLPAWVGASPPPPGELPRLLFVISLHSGGTPQTNQDLMLALQPRAECLVLRCAEDELVLYLFHSGDHVPLERHRLAAPVPAVPHTSDEYDRVAAAWLRDYAVSLVHIRHLAWQGLGLIRVAKQLDLPVICSFHDYYAVCPSLKLLDEHQRYCGGRCTASGGECTAELWPQEALTPLKHDGVLAWQQRFAGALALCDALVTTTAAARALHGEIFPALAERPFEVIPHGRDFPQLSALAERPVVGEPLRVLLPGHVAVAKGARVLLELARLPALAHVEWHVLGTLEGELLAQLPANVVVHGPYRREAFAEEVAALRPHLGAVLSIWPETWCHTLTELWSVGVPVIGFDIGAVGERLAASGAGWPVSPLSAEAVAETLQHASRPEAWDHAARRVTHWQRHGQTRCAEMADAYWALYERLCPALRAPAPA